MRIYKHKKMLYNIVSFEWFNLLQGFCVAVLGCETWAIKGVSLSKVCEGLADKKIWQNGNFLKRVGIISPLRSTFRKKQEALERRALMNCKCGCADSETFV
jgi:hypothetical protein